MTHPLVPLIRDAGVIATLRAPSTEAAYLAVDSLVAAEVVAIEVTYSTPDAASVIAGIDARFGGAIVLGAGTVTSAAQVAEASDAGARFLVSPGFDQVVFHAIVATERMSMVGAFTPTEVQNLAKQAVDIVKFFPGSIGGPTALKALRGPFPDLRYVPTGGVSAATIGAWLAAGAIAVGAGSELLPPAALRELDGSAITAAAKGFMAALRRAREAETVSV
jgi:2-dehydro-3-deoxyphosphogluconate aldolase / (4S)-4-hydroxy-2-oxoglutarate aldolase